MIISHIEGQSFSWSTLSSLSSKFILKTWKKDYNACILHSANSLIDVAPFFFSILFLSFLLIGPLASLWLDKEVIICILGFKKWRWQYILLLSCYKQSHFTYSYNFTIMVRSWYMINCDRNFPIGIENKDSGIIVTICPVTVKLTLDLLMKSLSNLNLQLNHGSPDIWYFFVSRMDCCNLPNNFVGTRDTYPYQGIIIKCRNNQFLPKA